MPLQLHSLKDGKKAQKDKMLSVEWWNYQVAYHIPSLKLYYAMSSSLKDFTLKPIKLVGATRRNNKALFIFQSC